MELRYGYKETYKYELDQERLDWLTKQTNRSNGQTQFLFQLVDGNFEKLQHLELKLKDMLGCPGTKEEVEKILNSYF